MNAYLKSMMYRATVSERGQVTIPKPLRDRLGIRPGEVLTFTEERGKLIARKAMPADPVERVYAILRGADAMPEGGGTDEYLEIVRGPAEGGT